LVFDVSKSEHYGKEGGYRELGAKDVSVGLVKMKFDPEYYDHTKYYWRKDLTDEEL
jgi:hypothetical protein